MERLNEIINRTAQRRQQEANSRSNYSAPPQGPRHGAAPGHRPLPEQNARLGQYGNAPRTQQQPGPANRAATPPPRIQQSSPLTRAPANAANQTHYTQGNRSAGERFAPAPERGSWQQAHRVPARHAENYRPAPQGDTRADWPGEWEEDTAPIRYGDWESDGYDEAAPARDASESYLLNRASARIAQTYPRNQRSMVTRELRSQLDEEVEPTVTPQARETRLPIPLPPPPATQRAGQSARLTQPLNRSTSTESIKQDFPRVSVPARPRGYRELTMQTIPAPYVSSNSPCPICKGAGYLRADVQYGDPSFGKPIACRCKETERKQKRHQELEQMSDLATFKGKSFENFNWNEIGVVEAYDASITFAREPNGWLLLIGPNGCGKTHLAAAIASQSLDKGALVLFATVPDLLDHLRAAFAPTATEVYDKLFARMREAEVLVLDDLGAQQSTPWANEKLFQLINYRYNNRFPTIITANSKGLEGLDERIYSRIMDTSLVTKVVMNRAGDYRLRNPRRY
jgi:DNA replication protein DnaC